MAPTEELSNSQGRILSINTSKTKGVAKQAVSEANLIEEFGLENDGHSGPGLRQVSLLSIESIRRQAECPKAKKKGVALGPGDFAENITTEGIDLAQLKLGTRLSVGSDVVVEISKIGKECHKFCAIYDKLGDCIMPREGIFVRVLVGGKISVGDDILVTHRV